MKGILLYDSFDGLLDGLENWLEKNVYNFNKYVTISKTEYENLLMDNRYMIALEGSGVKNWEGYAEAIKKVTTKLL